MVTTITLEGPLLSKREMEFAYSEALIGFEKLLQKENCQLINISASELRRGAVMRSQVITAIWTGNSSKIRSSYTICPQPGFWGGVKPIEFE